MCKHFDDQQERSLCILLHCMLFHACITLLQNTDHCLYADTESDASWRSEVTQLLKALLHQPGKVMVPQEFSRVGSSQADRILASLGIVGCVGNAIDPIVVSESTPASQEFDYSQYVNESAGTLNLLKHHQAELTKFGVKFGKGAFTMYGHHEHENPYPIVHDGQEYHGGFSGGIAPHGLSIDSAANQLRVAYEHKQSNAQKQRYRERYGDIAQVLHIFCTSLHVC